MGFLTNLCHFRTDIGHFYFQICNSSFSLRQIIITINLNVIDISEISTVFCLLFFLMEWFVFCSSIYQGPKFINQIIIKNNTKMKTTISPLIHFTTLEGGGRNIAHEIFQVIIASTYSVILSSQRLKVMSSLF